MHIGLQFQIEHHLFPLARLPRQHLCRATRKLAKAIAKKHDIHYHDPGFFEGPQKVDGGTYQRMLWGGMNAKG